MTSPVELATERILYLETQVRTLVLSDTERRVLCADLDYIRHFRCHGGHKNGECSCLDRISAERLQALCNGSNASQETVFRVLKVLSNKSELAAFYGLQPYAPQFAGVMNVIHRKEYASAPAGRYRRRGAYRRR